MLKSVIIIFFFFSTGPIYHSSLRQTSGNIREVCVPSSAQEICDTQLKGKGNIWEHGSFLCSTLPGSGGSQIFFFLLASSLIPKAETQPCGMSLSKPCVVTPTGRYFTGNFHRSFFFDSNSLLGFASQLHLSVISWLYLPKSG